MRRFVLAAMMFGAVSGAHAADMPDFPALRGGFTDGLNTARVNWQGFYIGGQAGYGSITSGQNATAGNAALESTFVPPTGLAYQWATLGEPHATGFGLAVSPVTTGNRTTSSSVSKAIICTPD